MKRKLAVIALGGLVSAVAAADAPAASQANSRLFADSVGDVQCCTRDVSRVRVSNDDAGRITFAITAPDGTGEGQRDDDDLLILVDADRDGSTGSPDGVDYLLLADVGWRGAEAVSFRRWNASRSDFVEVSGKLVRASVEGDVFRFTLDRHTLGDTDGFRFRVELWEVTSLGGAHSEFAPEQGMWDFRVGLRLGRPRAHVSTSAARSGRLFAARLTVSLGGSRTPLASGRIHCRASVAGVGLQVVRRSYVSRRAVCLWRIPAGTRGKVVLGRIGVFVTAARSSFVGRTVRSRVT